MVTYCKNHKQLVIDRRSITAEIADTHSTEKDATKTVIVGFEFQLQDKTWVKSDTIDISVIHASEYQEILLQQEREKTGKHFVRATNF